MHWIKLFSADAERNNKEEKLLKMRYILFRSRKEMIDSDLPNHSVIFRSRVEAFMMIIFRAGR